MAEEEKEHPGTARQRERFIERGEMPQVKELSGALILAVCGVVVATSIKPWAQNIGLLMRICFGAGTSGGIELWALSTQTFWLTLRPVLVAALMVALGAGLLRQNGQLHFRALKFDLGRINPLTKLGNMFGNGLGLGALFGGFVKMLAVALVAGSLLRQRLPTVLGHVPVSLGAASFMVGDLVCDMFLRGTLVLLILGAWDYYRSWIKLERRMTMSSQEVRDEVKEQVGDPAVRGRIRSKAKEIMQKRMLLRVPKAAVVVTNPTHVAVALMYKESSMKVPVVVAKGAGDWAARIRAVARRHGVPIVSDPPLARQLYGEVELADPVPEKLYHAVAVLLAHVYALRKRMV